MTNAEMTNEKNFASPPFIDHWSLVIGHSQLLLVVIDAHWRLGQDVVDDAVGLRLLGAEEEVPVGVLLDSFQWLAGMERNDVVERVMGPLNFGGLNLDVADLPLHAAIGLMQHDARMRQAESLPLGASEQQHGSSARRLTDAVG